jgi:hypothetical protein
MELDKHIYSFRQRWNAGFSLGACFAWPQLEVVPLTLTAQGVGDIVVHSEKMPNWRYRITHGLNATTLFQATRCALEYTEGHVFLGKWCPSAGRFGFYQHDGDLFQGDTAVWLRPSAPATTIDAKTRDEALQRAIRDARGKQTHFRGGNFLAELGDTIRGFRNPVKGFRDLLGVYHRNARKRVKRAIGRRAMPVTQQDFRRLEKDAPDVSRAAQRALSDTWLEQNFGWAPLLSDAGDAYQALRRLSAKTPLERFFGRSSNDGTPTYVSSSRNLEITPMDFTVRTVSRSDVTFYGAVKVEVDTPFGSAIEEMGVRARDFVPAVWEAIPYSFLIDYFSNVGDVIEAVSFPRSDIAWVSRTYRNHSIRSTERVAVRYYESPGYPAVNSNKVWSFQPPRVQWTRTYVQRDVYTGSLVPSLRLEIPGSKNWKKWLNIAALARLRTL